MRVVIALTLIVGLCLSVSAEKPQKKEKAARAAKVAATHKQLLGRIAELEQRVTKLEAVIKERLAFAPPTATPVPYSQPYRQLTPQPYIPNPPKSTLPAPTPEPPFRSQTPKVLPVPPSPAPPKFDPKRQFAPPLPTPPRAQPKPPLQQAPGIKQTVPKGWQRFEFNGQTFYIVPTDQVPKGDKPSIRK